MHYTTLDLLMWLMCIVHFTCLCHVNFLQMKLADREVFAYGLSRGTHSVYDCVSETTEMLNRYQSVLVWLNLLQKTTKCPKSNLQASWHTSKKENRFNKRVANDSQMCYNQNQQKMLTVVFRATALCTTWVGPVHSSF